MLDLYFTTSFLLTPLFFYLVVPRYVMELRLKECDAGWATKNSLDGSRMIQGYDDRKFCMSR